MYKLLLSVLIALLLSTGTSYADDIEAEACDHNTGKCYPAEVDLDFDLVTIYFEKNKGKELDLEYFHKDDMTALDESTGIYYDIELEE